MPQRPLTHLLPPSNRDGLDLYSYLRKQMPESEAAVPQIKSCKREFKGEFQKEHQWQKKKSCCFFSSPAVIRKKLFGNAEKPKILRDFFFFELTRAAKLQRHQSKFFASQCKTIENPCFTAVVGGMKIQNASFQVNT